MTYVRTSGCSTWRDSQNQLQTDIELVIKLERAEEENERLNKLCGRCHEFIYRTALEQSMSQSEYISIMNALTVELERAE